MRNVSQIPVIDLFAGPGGLGEGFSTFSSANGINPFRIALSIEMDEWAHTTLLLRSFFRQFSPASVSKDYYAYLRGEIALKELFSKNQKEAKAASQEAWRAELGVVAPSKVDRRIRSALGGSDLWVLCGGPPCQAFSVVGRSRNGGIAEDDERVYLYRQYLRILSEHKPPVFIMENVKGLLSSEVGGSEIFEQMLIDLRRPGNVFKTTRHRGPKYALHSLVLKATAYASDGQPQYEPLDFVIKCEDYGIPQTRHRVIILGVREDLDAQEIPVLKPLGRTVSASKVLKGLPRLRSGVTRLEDGKSQWKAALASIIKSEFMRSRRNGSDKAIRDRIDRGVHNLRDMDADRGGEFIPYTANIEFEPDWFLDPAIGGVCNHTSRPHMTGDLHRYLFAACYARVHGRSPALIDFPFELLPDHRSLKDGLSKGHFDDRFRVQIASRPATTITSHLSRDGHYYIHYDETQCRSLTVREAARLQTFPDNYYFCGPRTHQYRQVGNAVPPLLARQIADVVVDILTCRSNGKRTKRPKEVAVQV